ncbi:MAG: hypothetical protein IJA34_08220 [Lachnospiraceae bacterium]|nr:hypothetical protein [Lachnospiraceae bacterium]
MKELIGKLSHGIIENNIAELEVSVTSIEESIEAGTVFRGKFEIFNKNEGELKGIIYSSNEYLRILNDQFVGKNSKIEYEVNTKYMEPGDIISGKINIVSNGGEVFIPFMINIIAESIPSSIGNISNIFHFLNLVKQEYDEAVKMFLSPDFKRIILGKNVADRCMYDGLIKSANSRRALEEFVIAINKKQKVEFEISDSVREYDSLIESYGDLLLLSRNTWGLLEISVETEGDFICDYKKMITDEDFAGNNYEFTYLIDVNKLHSGLNYGKIVFASINNRFECSILVDNIKGRDNSKFEVKKCLSKLNQLYLDFRMRKCQLDKWSDESLSLIERARGFNDNNMFLKLLQAQVYLSKKDDENAKWLLDSVGENILDRKEENIPLYCFYLYVRTLQKRELDNTLMTTEIIKKYYENGYDKWELLWILMYIDPSFENNKSLKITRIKEQFKLGCHSTLMYYEALYVFNKQPALLRVLNDFELQVLNFGSKYDGIELRLAVQISELSMLEKSFRPLLFGILVKLYKKFENKTILTAILSVLIRGNKTDTKYFEWYELGVKADIQVTRLYEYYIFSMPKDYDELLPNTILMYYVYNANLLYDREAFFYSLVIKHKDRNPNMYKNYVKNIEKFALEKLRKGEIDEELSIIYEDILTTSMITEENEKNLPKILNTWKITLTDDFINEVIVFHKEIKDKTVYKVNKKCAYINVYTEDVIILFRDLNNNVYLNSIGYTIQKLYENKELNEEAVIRNEDNIYLVSKECEQSIKYQKRLKNGVTLFNKIIDNDSFNEEYQDYILSDIIEYYSNNFDSEDLDEFLKNVNITRLSRESRVSIIELMITRGLYDEVLEYINLYGTYGIDSKKILKFVTYILRNGKEDLVENILIYCSESFKKSKYNELSLEHLCNNFNGTTREMMELWRISKDFSIESRDLEERIIAQMLFSRTNVSSISVIYDSYYRKGSLKLIKKAYLFYQSYIYFVKETPIDELFFRHLEDEMIFNENVLDICKCSYLLYNSDKDSLSERTLEICRNSIVYLEKAGIIFDFYKNYDKFFDLSGKIMDKTTIVYRTEPADKVLINYYIETGNLLPKDYISEEMKQVFPGMYIKSYTLFYGEKINYYIMETRGEDSVLTESCEYNLDDRTIEVSNSRFGKLNDILVCRELKDEKLVRGLAKEYYINNELVKRLFG